MNFEDAPLPEDGGNNLFTRDWPVPWHAHVAPLAIVVLLAGLWLGSDGQMASWAVSWQLLSRNPVLPIFTHIVAHGGLVHILMNSAVLLLLSGPLISRLGKPPIAWLRYLYLLVGSGVSGATFFLLLNNREAASMLGASGAVFGLLGMLARIHPSTGNAVPIRSPRTWMVVKLFVQNHLVLFAVLAVIAFLSGGGALVAWEAHLGGLLFGFFVAPLFLKFPPLDEIQTRGTS
ncbi:rhomboid family intramembrane serine protease [Erythrobacter sp. QSSC1-22B]|uniref:rhomboid family intramembrane serine protease n=1 Tax=Erythrobacter sp. QSSC1-22B TaxID=1860125 RepID=UPI0009F4AEF2